MEKVPRPGISRGGWASSASAATAASVAASISPHVIGWAMGIAAPISREFTTHSKSAFPNYLSYYLT